MKTITDANWPRGAAPATRRPGASWSTGSRGTSTRSTQGFRLAPDEADDVFQDVFTRAYERLDTLRSDEALRPWIGQLTRRCCLDRLRSRARERPAEGDVLEEVADEEALDRVEEALTVHDALGALSPTARRSSTAFSAETRVIGLSATSSGCPAGRSRAGSRAA